MAKRDITVYMDNLLELERKIKMGYVAESDAFAVDKFSKRILANGVISLMSSFNNLNPFLDTPTELFIASNSASDTFDVVIQYIDQNRDNKKKTVKLTGTTPVSVGTDIYCIWRMYNNNGVNQVGTRVVVTSNATGIPASDSEVYCDLVIDDTTNLPAQQSLTSVFSIPRNFIGFELRASIQADKGGDVKASLFARKQGKVFRYARALQAYQNKSDFNGIFARIDETTDLKVLAFAQSGAETYLEQTFICVHKDLIDTFLGV